MSEDFKYFIHKYEDNPKQLTKLISFLAVFSNDHTIIEMVKQNCNTIVEIIYVFWGIPPQTPVD